MRKDQDTIKYFAYVRKSSESQERQALSIIAQKEKIQKQFSSLDIEWVEEEHSAFTPGRPRFGDMLGKISLGKRTGLIGWHPDRLSRNEIDASSITYMIRTGKIADLKLCTYHFENTPEGIWMLQMALSQSQYESAKKGRDVKRGLEQKAKMGHPPFPAIPGYINIGEKKGFKEWTKDPVRFDTHRKMFDLVLAGQRPAKVWKMVNDEWGYQTLTRGTKIGNKKMARSAFYKMLTDIKYTGNFEYGGVRYKGAYPAMITMDEYDRIQLLLGRKGRPRPRKNNLPYIGLMNCPDCTASISVDDKKQAICAKCKTKFSTKNTTICPNCRTDISEMNNPTLLHYIYYGGTGRINPNCQNCRKSVEIRKFEKQIDAELEKFEIDSDYLTLALDYLKEGQDTGENADRKINESLELALGNLNTRIDNLDKNFNSPQNAKYEIYTPERYKELMTPLQKEKEALAEQLGANKVAEPRVLELTKDTFNFCAYARYWLRNGGNDTKNAILSGLGSNITLSDRKLRFEAYEPYLIINGGLKIVREQNKMSEPKNIGLNTNQNTLSGAGIATGLRGQDSNLQPSP